MPTIKQDITLLITSIDKAIKELFKRSGIDPSYSDRITIDFDNDTVNVYVSEGLKYVDSGRAKGARMPPVDSIMRWISSKGIQVPNGMTKQSVAFAIAKSISARGIKPRPFIDRLNDLVAKLVTEYVSKQIDKLLKTI